MYKLDDKSREMLNNHKDLNGKQVHMLCISGSLGYGTNTGNSDLDVRGICENRPEDILGFPSDFESGSGAWRRFEVAAVQNEEVDITIYSLDKAIRLLAKQNPNTIELLGLREDNYIQLDDIGKLLIENRRMFLSKDCFRTFGKYVKQQFHKMEIHQDSSLRNAKNTMHLLRLYYTCTDILNEYDIITYREKEHDILMMIRNGWGFKENGELTQELKNLIKEAETKTVDAYLKSKIPDRVDLNKVAKFAMELNIMQFKRRGII